MSRDQQEGVGRPSRPYSQLRTHSAALISAHQAHAGILNPSHGPGYSISTSTSMRALGMSRCLAFTSSTTNPSRSRATRLPVRFATVPAHRCTSPGMSCPARSPLPPASLTVRPLGRWRWPRGWRRVLIESSSTPASGRDFNGHIHRRRCPWGCALEATIRGAKRIPENADAPTGRGYRATFWESSPGAVPAGGVIEQARDRKAISGLIGPHRRLRLGRIEAIDRARVKPEVAQMHLRDLDVSSVQESIHRGAYSPGLVFPG